MRIRQRLLGITFPVEDDLFRCFTCDSQGALAQSRPGDELQLVHVKNGNNFAAYAYSIRLNRLPPGFIAGTTTGVMGTSTSARILAATISYLS